MRQSFQKMYILSTYYIFQQISAIKYKTFKHCHQTINQCTHFIHTFVQQITVAVLLNHYPMIQEHKSPDFGSSLVDLCFTAVQLRFMTFIHIFTKTVWALKNVRNHVLTFIKHQKLYKFYKNFYTSKTNHSIENYTNKNKLKICILFCYQLFQSMTSISC